MQLMILGAGGSCYWVREHSNTWWLFVSHCYQITPIILGCCSHSQLLHDVNLAYFHFKLSIKNLISLTIFDNFDFFVFRCSFWNTNDRRKSSTHPSKSESISVPFHSIPRPVIRVPATKNIHRIPPCDHQPPNDLPKILDQRSLQEIASKKPLPKTCLSLPPQKKNPTPKTPSR